MENKINSEDLYQSIKPNLGKFYKEAKAAADPELLTKEIDSIKNLRLESRRYVQPRIHAKGGMKMIISSTDRLVRRQIAIAKLKENKLTKDSLKLFLHEARVLARLDHPNIVPLYDIGVDSGNEPYFIMKLLSGESLASIIKKLCRDDDEYKKNYPLPVLLDIFLKVCNATAFAHSRNIIHRDLKPANIQVSSYGEVLLCDWGLAKDINLPAQSTAEIYLSEIMSQQTLYGVIKGTPGFMSPEQIDNSEDINEKTDIYALGCLLYSLLTYHLPFESKTVDELMKDTVEGNVIPASKRSSNNIPKALEAVTQKAMSLKPEDRYSSVEALAEEVQNYLNGFATEAENADFTTHFYLLAKRHKAILAAITVSFLIIGMLTAVFFFQVKKERDLANKALDDVKRQKYEKNKLSMVAAPEFFKRAKTEHENRNFLEALKLVRLANALQESEESLQLLGYLELGAMNFFDAAAAFSKLKSDPKSKELYDLCLNAAKQEEIDPIELVKSLYKDELIEMVIPNLMHTINTQSSSERSQEIVLELYKYFHSGSKSPGLSFINDGTGIKFSSGRHLKISHLYFFTGMELTSADLSHADIERILGLEKMPVKSLNLYKTDIVDLEWVSYMPVEELNIAHTKISYIGPLVNKNSLRTLNISNTYIRDSNELLNFTNLEHLILNQKQYDKSYFSRVCKKLKKNGVKITIAK